MRLTITAHDAATDHYTTAFLDITADMHLVQLQAILVNLLGSDISGSDTSIAIDGTVYPGETPLSETGLRPGSWVSLLGPGHHPRAVIPPPRGSVQLRTVSGHGAGQTLHASAGSVPILAATPVTFAVNPDRTVEAIGPQTADNAGAPLINGEPITGVMPVQAGAQIALGDRIIEIRDHTPEPAAVEFVTDTGAVKYNRPPRFLPPEPPAYFRLPSPPEEPTRAKLPWMTSLIPLAFALVMSLALNNPRMLAFGLMSPMMMIANFVNGQKQGARRYRQEVADHADLTARIEHDAAEAVVNERDRRLFLYPDAAEVAVIATTPTPRLWERRYGDEHHLVLRCGTATQPSGVVLEDPEQLEHRRQVVRDVIDAPATVSLHDVGVLGVAGADGASSRLARWFVAQLGVLQSPKDVQLYVLSAPDTQNDDGADDSHVDWGFAAWLPHTRPLFGQECMRTVGFGAQSLARRIAELQQIIDQRKEAAAQQVRTREPAVVVVMEGAHRLRAMPGVTRILTEGPAYQVFSICLDFDARLLPEECATVVDIIGTTELSIRRHREDPIPHVLPDWVDEDWLDWVARALAPMEDASPQVSDVAIPEASRLLDVIGLEPPTAQAIAARWLLNPRSTTATVGESIDGAFSLDLAADGPHALVAGTTGSGKSELLQTLVASLAVTNSPEGMTFVLVDYKGGAAFKDCVNLPHTVGMVTDLDTHLVERALDSLGAELRYREHVLSAAGAKDLDDYLDLAVRRPDLEAMPRLAIVIDEFASLARELPDFVTGLVNIAQRGRSLGIHLVLATQRPSGVVSSEIRANTNLRIALRVTDAAESSDVIDAPDAARIGKSTPGRAYVRLGSNSLIPFQSGRVGGRRPTQNDNQAPEEPLVRRLVLSDFANPSPQRPSTATDSGDVERTDLSELVQAVRGAAQELKIAEPRKPWLPALPALLTLTELDLPACTDTGAPIPYGRADLAAEQRQPLAVLDLEGDASHLAIIGAARTGRTTALRTIAAATATVYPTDQAHIYGIDAGNGGLLALRGLPHVGAIVTRSQIDEATRLVTRLRAELKRRQELLSTAGYADATEQRQAVTREERLPRLILLLDSWDGFTAAFESIDNGSLVESVRVLLREGASAGIHLVLTGDRQLSSGRMGTLIDDKIALRLIERTDYSMFGLNPRKVPENMEPGRGFRGGSGTELQFAVVSADPTGQGQREYLNSLAAELADRDRELPNHSRPFGVESMPAQLTYDDLHRRATALGEDSRLFIGVGGENVEPMGFDPVNGPGAFIVGGPGMSGRSTTLLTIVRTALEHDYDIVAIAPRTSPLRDLRGPGVRAVLTDTELTQHDLEPLFQTEPDGPRVLVAVDDADMLRGIPADQWLRTVVPSAKDLRLTFVLSGTAEALAKGFSGWIAEARKARQGVLLRPANPIEGDLIGGKLRRSDITNDAPIGRAFLHTGPTSTIAIQIARTDSVPDASEEIA